MGSLKRRADNGPLAGSQTVGFDHDGCPDLIQMGFGLFGVIEDFVIGGGDFVFPHQVLGETLTSFDHGGVAAGAEDLEAARLECIDDSEGQGDLWTHQGEVDFLLGRKVHEVDDVGGSNGDTGSDLGHPGVTRGGVEEGLFGTLGQLPEEGMFPSPLSNHEDFHHQPPLRLVHRSLFTMRSGTPVFQF